VDTGVKTDPLYWDEKIQNIISRVKEIGQESGSLNDINQNSPSMLCAIGILHCKMISHQFSPVRKNRCNEKHSE
jgi:hypothetical protein